MGDDKSDAALRDQAYTNNCYVSGSPQTQNIPYVYNEWDYISPWNKDFPKKVYQQWPVGQYYSQSYKDWDLVNAIRISTNEDMEKPKIFGQDQTPGKIGEEYDYIYLYNQNLLPVVPEDVYPVNKSPAALQYQNFNNWYPDDPNNHTHDAPTDISNAFRYDDKISQRINLNSHTNYPMFTTAPRYRPAGSNWTSGDANHPIVETKWFSEDPKSVFNFNNANQGTLDTCGYFFKSREGDRWKENPPILANLINEPAGDWLYWGDTHNKGNNQNAGGMRQNCYVQNLGRSSPASYVNIAGIDYNDFVLDKTSTSQDRPLCGKDAPNPLRGTLCPKECPPCATLPMGGLATSLAERRGVRCNYATPGQGQQDHLHYWWSTYAANEPCATPCTIQELDSSFDNTIVASPDNPKGKPPWCFTDPNHICMEEPTEWVPNPHDPSQNILVKKPNWGFCSPCDPTYDKPVEKLPNLPPMEEPPPPFTCTSDSIRFGCATAAPLPNSYPITHYTPPQTVACPATPLPADFVPAPCAATREELIKDCYNWIRSRDFTDSGGENQSLIWQWSPDPKETCGTCTSIAFINRLAANQPGSTALGGTEPNKNMGAYENLYPYWTPNQNDNNYNFGYSGVILPTKRQKGREYSKKENSLIGCEIDNKCTPFDRLGCNLLQCSSPCSSSPLPDDITHVVPASYKSGLLDYMYYNDAMFLSGSRRFKLENISSMDECYGELQKAKQATLMATQVNTDPQEGTQTNDSSNLYPRYCPDYQPIWANYSPKQKTCEIYNVRKDNSAGNQDIMWVGGSWYQGIDSTDDYFKHLKIGDEPYTEGDTEDGKPKKFKCGDRSMGGDGGGFMSILKRDGASNQFTCTWYEAPIRSNDVYTPPHTSVAPQIDQYAFNNRDGNDPICPPNNRNCTNNEWKDGSLKLSQNSWTPGDDNDNKFLIDAEPIYRQLKECCMGQHSDETPCPQSTVSHRGVNSTQECDAIMEGWCKAYHATHPDEDYPDECKCISAPWIYVDRGGYVVPKGTPNSMSLSVYNNQFLPPEIVKATKSVYCGVLPCQAGYYNGKEVYIPTSYFNNQYECPTGICSQIINVVGDDNRVQLESTCKGGFLPDGTGTPKGYGLPSHFTHIINYMSIVLIIFILASALFTFIFKKPPRVEKKNISV